MKAAEVVRVWGGMYEGQLRSLVCSAQEEAEGRPVASMASSEASRSVRKRLCTTGMGQLPGSGDALRCCSSESIGQHSDVGFGALVLLCGAVRWLSDPCGCDSVI